ncbi:hypothetical protein LQW54_006684 [Pestalotiopsis sp. IQ-011]
MPSGAITGVSRGLGSKFSIYQFEFLKQISADPNKLVIGLVREKEAAQQKIASELGEHPNVHIVYADLTQYDTIKAAAEDTAEITGGRLDYIIANGAYNSLLDAYYAVGVLGEKPQELEQVALELYQTNAIGQLHLFNLFTPLLLKGKTKKAVAISSAQSDLDFINNVGAEISTLYSMSKAALNVVVAKFSAQYKKQGVLFLGICPGSVDVGYFKDVHSTPSSVVVSVPFDSNTLTNTSMLAWYPSALVFLLPFTAPVCKMSEYQSKRDEYTDGTVKVTFSLPLRKLSPSSE